MVAAERAVVWAGGQPAGGVGAGFGRRGGHREDAGRVCVCVCVWVSKIVSRWAAVLKD